jgi:hypothetical protein
MPCDLRKPTLHAEDLEVDRVAPLFCVRDTAGTRVTGKLQQSQNVTRLTYLLICSL